MSLSQNGFAFLSARHMPVVPSGPFDLPIVVGQFMGVKGESHIVGQPWGREITCDITIDGYATNQAIEVDLQTLDSKIGNLTGDLTETIGAGTRTYDDCTFLGYQVFPPGIFYDGSGSNGWVCFLRLVWRQRRIST